MGITINLPDERVNESQEILSHEITLIKTAKKQLNQEKIEESLTRIFDRLLDNGRSNRGWSIEKEPRYWSMQLDTLSGGYLYAAKFKIENHTRRNSLPVEFENTIISILIAACITPKWKLHKIDDEVYDNINMETGEAIEVAIPDDWRMYFNHIYERDDQIDILMSSLTAAIDSNFNNRFHVVLHGAPASGKTELVRAFKSMLDPEAVMEYDATSTTQAGAQRQLASMAVTPRILIVEEIEKASEESMRWLLSILDQRAEIRKVNYNVNIQRSVKLVCVATVNNYKLFKSQMSGALASRFTHKLKCPRPSKEILRLILQRELENVPSSNESWVDPAIDFCVEHGINDPRQVIAICLCGKDDLLDGSYQRKYLNCSSFKEDTVKKVLLKKKVTVK